MFPSHSECAQHREGQADSACFTELPFLSAYCHWKWDYFFRGILIVSNNCYQEKVMFEVLGKCSLCWPAFPKNRLFWGLEPIEGVDLWDCSRWLWARSVFLVLPDYYPVSMSGMRDFVHGYSALFFSTAESVSIWGMLWVALPLILHPTWDLRIVFTCKWLVSESLASDKAEPKGIRSWR